MRAFITYSTYKIEEGKSYVYLFGRLENGKSFLSRHYYQPYFFIRKKDDSKVNKLVNVDLEKTSFKNFKGELMSKIVVDTPQDIKVLRDKFEETKIKCYEADLRLEYRFLIDKKISGTLDIEGDISSKQGVDCYFKEAIIKPVIFEPSLKTVAIDIETDKNAKKIYCISFYSKDYKTTLIVSDKKIKNTISLPDEKSLLKRFKEIIISLDPDIITGWNVIDFDFKVLLERFRVYAIPFNIGRAKWNCNLRLETDFMKTSKANFPGRMVLDGIDLLKISFIQLKDYKLDTVAEHFLGVKKLIQFKNKGEEIEELFKTNPSKLTKYNLKDAKLVIDILEKSKVLALTIKRSLLTGMPLDRIQGSIASFDSLYLKELRTKGIIAPSSVFGERKERIKGGYVMSSKPGIYDYVIVCDFKSLYPSIIRTFNIDPFTYVKSCRGKNLIKSPNGACFRKEEGILSGMIQHLWKERDKIKQKKDDMGSYAIKVVMNSLFGVMANPVFRFHNINVANAITHFGQYFIKSTAKQVEAKGYEVIYGDSITKERCIPILDEKGLLNITPIGQLFKKYGVEVIKKRGKEFVKLNKNIKVLSLNRQTLKPKFSRIKTIIRHKPNKKVYRINQKFGETICTEDHSIITLKDKQVGCIKPTEINKQNTPFEVIKEIPNLKKLKRIDLYDYLKEYTHKSIYKKREKISKVKIIDKNWLSFSWTNQKKPVLLKRFISVDSEEFKSLCRLLGVYIAEGSASTIETVKSKFGASISSSDKLLLQQMQKDYNNLFKETKVNIRSSDKNKKRIIVQKNKTHIYNGVTLKLQMMNLISAVFFKMFCGQTSFGKKLPEFIYHVDDKYKYLLLEYMIEGGGNRYDDRCSEKFRKKQFLYDTNSLQLISGMSFLLKQLNFNFSIQYMPSEKSYRINTSENNTRLQTKLITEVYDDYVYDLSVKDEIFTDSCGLILLHNTDSIFVNLNVKTRMDAEDIGLKIQKEINSFFNEYILKEYGVDSYLELEFEKIYERFLMPKVRGSEKGAKKRYAGLLLKGKTKKLDFVGLEFVRRDWTDLSKKFQLTLLDKIFHKKEVTVFIKKFVKDLRNGKMDDLLIYRKALRKDISEYIKTTPPHVKAARLLDKIESNLIEYVITDLGPEPVQKLKSKIDYDHYIAKQIKPIADSVLCFYNTSFDDLMEGASQVSLFKFS